MRKFYLPADDRVGGEFDKDYNVKKLRFAEIKLIYAEALLETGGDRAIVAQQINDIRLRASASSRIDPFAYTPTSRVIKISDQPLEMVEAGDDLMEAIKIERFLELFGEGLRFWDIIRWGEASEKLAPYGFVEGVHELLPIPQNDVDLAGLKQNPGYF